MKAKIRTFFTRNIALKIISLLLGLGIWAILSNTQDPTITRTLNVPVNYVNAELLGERESLVMLSGPENVSINVSVRTSMQSQINASLFKCTADLTDHNGGDLSSQRVHITVEQIGGANLILDWSYARNDPNITVAMDTVEERSFEVELLATDELTEGLVLGGSVAFDPSSATVKGPTSKFANINAVKAVVSLSEFTDGNGGTFTDTVALELYDGNNQPIRDTMLSIQPASVEMTAIVSRVRTSDVKLLGTVGAVQTGYRYVSSEVEPEVVSVYGLKSTVADLSEIYIPDTAIDITGLTGDQEYILDIREYLPEGVSLLNESDANITVTVHVEALITETFPIQASDLILTGQNDSFEYEIDTDGLTLNVTGLEEDVKVFKISDAAPTVNLTGLSEGVHLVRVTVSRPAGYTYENANALTAKVTVKVKESNGQTEGSSGEDGSGASETVGD